MALPKTATKKRISGTGTVDALATRCLRLGLIYDRTDLRLNRLKVNTRFSIDVRQDRTHFLLQFCDWGEIGLGSGRRKALRYRPQRLCHSSSAFPQDDPVVSRGYWRLTDIPAQSPDVCYRGYSAHGPEWLRRPLMTGEQHGGHGLYARARISAK